MKAKKLPSGNWRVLVYDYTDAAGKRHYKSFTDPDKNVAMFMANDYLSHHRGEAVATYADLTLKQAAERYVDSKEGVLSPSTVKEYRRIIKNDFGRLMPMKLSKITPELVQVAIMVAIAVALGLIFRTQITDFVNRTFEGLDNF